MAYVSGSAASFADLKTAIHNACTANGWTLTSGVLNKSGCYFKFFDASAELMVQGGTGQSGTDLTGVIPDGSYPTQIRAGMMSGDGNEISFPLSYEVHIFEDPDEVYCVINYNSDFYQHIAFGKSDVPGIGGTGAWYSGTFRPITYWGTNPKCYLDIGESVAGFYTYAGAGGGLFAEQPNGGPIGSSFVHQGLDGRNWVGCGLTSHTSNILDGGYGSNYCSALLNSMPSNFNQASVLLQIKFIKYRNSGGITIVANLKNARYTRIDNLLPGEILSYGAEEWKVYPFFRKNIIQRNGVTWSTGALHSGTFAYAIKYTG